MDGLTGRSRRGLVFLFVVTLVGAISQAERAFAGETTGAPLVLFVAFSLASVILLWRLFDRNRSAE